MAKQDTKIALLEQSMAQNTREHKEIKEEIGKINDKLDAAIGCKANKTEVSEIRDDVSKSKNQTIGALLGALTAIIVALLGFILRK